MLTLPWRANSISLALHNLSIRNGNLACSSDMASCWPELYDRPVCTFSLKHTQNKSHKTLLLLHWNRGTLTRGSSRSVSWNQLIRSQKKSLPCSLCPFKAGLSFMLDSSPAFSSDFLSLYRLSGCLSFHPFWCLPSCLLSFPIREFGLALLLLPGCTSLNLAWSCIQERCSQLKISSYMQRFFMRPSIQ